MTRMGLHYTTLIPLSVNSVMMPYIHSLCYFSVELLVTEKANGYLAEKTLSSLRVCLEAFLQFLMYSWKRNVEIFEREQAHVLCLLELPGFSRNDGISDV